MSHATQPAESPTRRRLWLWVGLLVVLVLVASVAWLAFRANQAQSAAQQVADTADTLQAQVDAGDLQGVADTLPELASQAQELESITGDPVWAVASKVPVVGGRVQAARTLGSVASSLATPAAELAPMLPAFSSSALKESGGALPVDEIAAMAPTLEQLADAADVAVRDLAALDPGALSASQADQVASLLSTLQDAAPALRSASSLAPVAAQLLGSEGPKTYFVAFQNLAEARGTGGLVGAYAILTFDQGKVTLQTAAPRKTLDGSRIPLTGLPMEFRELWGRDATEWAGLNLSPHFPYTGQLISNGWKARGSGDLDGVIGIDQHVVAAMLAGTGPVTVRGVTVDADNAYTFLTKGVYAQFPDYPDKDAVVVALVQQVFEKLQSGDVDPVALAKALREPASKGSLLVWSADAATEQALGEHTVGGVLPDGVGPVVRAAVNNGAGNKLDAYLATKVTYYQGVCTDGVRTGSAVVTLTNNAPASGLPSYVTGRQDLAPAQRALAPVGSNKSLLYVYGPVGSDIALATIDDREVAVPVGVERGHPVWRIDVVLDPGQTKRVEVQFLQYVDPQADGAEPAVMRQLMAVPQTRAAKAGGSCTDTATSSPSAAASPSSS